MKQGEGLRYNSGKTRHDLVPAFAQEQYARVLTKGAEKYAERNWEKGMNWSTVLASMKRHILAFESGEDYDPETGLLHMAHVMCNAGFLTEYYKIYPQGDDRPQRFLSVPKIGLDIDEVLCDWVNAWRNLWSIEDVAENWFFDRSISERFSQMKSEGVLNEFYLNLPVKTKPSEIPFEPHCYITSRPVDVSVTVEWLDKNNFPARPVYCVGSDQTKVDVALQSGINLFVDDCYKNFVELNNAGICTFLFDAPHNRRYKVGYKRIKSLAELI